MKSLVFAAALLEVMGLSKTMPPQARRDDFISRACADWTLTTADVQYFFAHADRIGPAEWHYTYDAMPCEYHGSLAVDGQRYQYEINGGSFGVLIGTSAAGATYYGCKDRCARLFPFHLYGDE
jgi:hypothetical protein